MSDKSLVGLSKEDLIELLQAVRQPIVTPEEAAAKLQKEEDRKTMGETLARAEANRIQEQKNCAHMRSNGSTPAVYIANLNRMYCQHCYGWIYPQHVEGAKPHEVNPELFNKLYQLAQGVE